MIFEKGKLNLCASKTDIQLNIVMLLVLQSNTSLLTIIACLAILIVIQFIFYSLRNKNIQTLHNKNFALSKEIQNLTKANQELKDQLNQRSNEIAELSQIISKQNKEKQKLEEDVRHAKRVAEEADMLKSNFLANMSHEIRTPMNGILGFAQLMQTEEMDRNKHDRYLDIITHNGAMLVNLIDDIMDVSKIEAGQLALSRVKVNLDDLMFELYTFFNEVKFKQEKEHITIRLLNLNDDENSIFYSDEHRIRQVLTNLVGNALKFTEKGFVEFGYINNSDEKHIHFFVRDTGIGIPPDKLGIIFERFRQVQEGSTRRYGGTGIGLYISKHIIELLGGKIRVESEIDKGTTFTFTIPYETMLQEDESTSIFEPAKKEYNWMGKTIVIAEDVETNFYFLSAILAQTNAKVMWARDGQEAVNLCENGGKVDLILMDIQMPKLNGYEATAIIKQLNPEITVIAQTAYAMPNDNLKCIEAGCNDYISKPINTSLLLDKLDSYLAGQVKAKQ